MGLDFGRFEHEDLEWYSVFYCRQLEYPHSAEEYVDSAIWEFFWNFEVFFVLSFYFYVVCLIWV